jgi:hypothetical protein
MSCVSCCQIYRKLNFLRKPALLVALLFGLTSFLPGQRTGNCENRTVIVNVRDREGKFVAGLPPSSFRAKMHGQQLTVLSASVERAPRIVLLLDASGSMTSSKPKWEDAKFAIRSIVTSTRGNAHLALVLFANDVLETLDFNHSPEDLLQRTQQLGDADNADKLLPRGKQRTALLAALLYALSLFGTQVAGDAVYVVSDGGDNASRASSDKVEHALVAKGVRFYAFFLHDRFFDPAIAEQPGPMLTSLAEMTGGKVVDLELNWDSVPTGEATSQVKAFLPRVYDQMTQFYGVGLGPLKTMDKEQGWKLEIVDNQGKRRKDLNVAYPRKLPACHLSNVKEGVPGK